MSYLAELTRTLGIYLFFVGLSARFYLFLFLFASVHARTIKGERFPLMTRMMACLKGGFSFFLSFFLPFFSLVLQRVGD